MNTKLLERLEDRLKEFISTEEVPYGGGLMGDGYDKPQYPSLHMSRSTDAGLMKLPGEGSAMVRYRVKSRNIDESRDDGQPLYGASIEIQSLEPVSEEEEFGEARGQRPETRELEETVFLREFSWAEQMKKYGRPLVEKNLRGQKALLKTSKRNPLKIAKDGFGEFKVYPKGKPNHKGTYFTPDIADARGTAADLLKRKRAGQNVGFEERHFAEARDRDGEGRFAAGGIPGPRDYALAQAMAKKKKAAVGAGVGVGALAGGAALMRSNRGRQVFEGLRNRLVR